METVHTTTRNTQTLTQEALDAVEVLGTVLKPIYLRMKNEGYSVVDGKVIKDEQDAN